MCKCDLERESINVNAIMLISSVIKCRLNMLEKNNLPMYKMIQNENTINCLSENRKDESK